MKLTEYKLLIKTLIFSVVLYGIHKLLFLQFLAPGTEQRFVYSLELLYCFFFFASILISIILFAVNKKNIDNVGFTFLFLTVAKLGIAFFFMQPILKSKEIHQPTEKINFFVIFILFLAIETFIAIRILNNKQKII